MMKLIFHFEQKAREAVSRGADPDEIVNLPVREKIGRAKSIPHATYRQEFDRLTKEIDREMEGVLHAAN